MSSLADRISNPAPAAIPPPAQLTNHSAGGSSPWTPPPPQTQAQKTANDQAMLAAANMAKLAPPNPFGQSQSASTSGGSASTSNGVAGPAIKASAATQPSSTAASTSLTLGGYAVADPRAAQAATQPAAPAMPSLAATQPSTSSQAPPSTPAAIGLTLGEHAVVNPNTQNSSQPSLAYAAPVVPPNQISAYQTHYAPQQQMAVESVFNPKLDLDVAFALGVIREHATDMNNIIKEKEAAIDSAYQNIQACGAHPDVLGLFEQCAVELLQSKRQDAEVVLEVMADCAQGIIKMKNQYEAEAEETKQIYEAKLSQVEQQARDYVKLQLKDMQATIGKTTGEVHKAKEETRRANATISSLRIQLNRPSIMSSITQTWYDRFDQERQENRHLKREVATLSLKVQYYESTKANGATIVAQLHQSEASLSDAKKNGDAITEQNVALLAQLKTLTTCKHISPISYDSAQTKVMMFEAILKSLWADPNAFLRNEVKHVIGDSFKWVAHNGCVVAVRAWEKLGAALSYLWSNMAKYSPGVAQAVFNFLSKYGKKMSKEVWENLIEFLAIIIDKGAGYVAKLFSGLFYYAHVILDPEFLPRPPIGLLDGSGGGHRDEDDRNGDNRGGRSHTADSNDHSTPPDLGRSDSDQDTDDDGQPSSSTQPFTSLTPPAYTKKQLITRPIAIKLP